MVQRWPPAGGDSSGIRGFRHGLELWSCSVRVGKEDVREAVIRGRAPWGRVGYAARVDRCAKNVTGVIRVMGC